MGLLDKLLRRPTKEEKQEVDPAYQFGQNAAQSMVRDLDSFMAARFGHLKEGYLDILRKNVTEAITRADHSPLLIARGSYSLLLEGVARATPRMKAEIMDHMREWQSAFEVAGLGAEVGRVTDARLSDFWLDLTLCGLTVVTDRADELKAADDAWRLAHPEQAAAEPLGN